MNARKCVYAQKPYPFPHSRMNQAMLEKERKWDRKDRSQEADGKKSSPSKQKPIGGTETRPTWAQLPIANKILVTQLPPYVNVFDDIN